MCREFLPPLQHCESQPWDETQIEWLLFLQLSQHQSQILKAEISTKFAPCTQDKLHITLLEGALEMSCVHFVCNIFHFAWKWVVFHFVCIYMKKLHFHLFTRDKSYLTMILLLEKELTIYSMHYPT